MSLSSLLTKLTNVRGAIVSAICSKGVELASSATLHECASAIQSISVGSGGAEVTLGYVDSDGHFQPVTFSGSAGISSGSAVTVSNYYTWSVSGCGSSDPGSSGVAFRLSSGADTSSAAVVTNIVITSGGYMTVSSGGTANSTTVNSGGYLRVSSGGTANSTTINPRGYLYVSRSGTATEIVENGGYVVVADGANVTFTPNAFSGLMLNLASATVHSGTTANSTTINYSGYLYVYDGGLANSTTVTSGCSMRVSSGGTANEITVNPGGYLRVSSGGTALVVTSMAGAVVTVDEGGYIEYASSGEE